MTLRLWAMLSAALLLALACGTAPSAEKGSAPTASPTVLLPDGSHLSLQIADKPMTQERGLMFVRALPDDEGMLFLFDEEGPHPFWMKNCEMAIDMVWLDASFRVLDITHSAPPCHQDPCPTFSPKVPVRHVLEVRGGLAQEKGLKEGDALVVVGLSVTPGEYGSRP